MKGCHRTRPATLGERDPRTGLVAARPGRVRCLRCDKAFPSADVRRNRICPPCNVILNHARPAKHLYRTRGYARG
ncbi:MAG: hypothetical protein M5U26_08260 [Planctomycetota bacterium]|nr:hypothetical protein [Planctomycetota bacterium]